jgi:hypothetical protein
MRTVRASEIETYIFCQRAWWYQKQGQPSENQAETAAGTELHYRHSRHVMATGCLRVGAYVLLLLSLVVLAFYLTLEFL